MYFLWQLNANDNTVDEFFAIREVHFEVVPHENEMSNVQGIFRAFYKVTIQCLW